MSEDCHINFDVKCKKFAVPNDDEQQIIVTVTPKDMLEGVMAADKNGEQIIGTIPTVQATLSKNTVTVPAGYIKTAQTLTVPEAANPTVADNKVTIYQGYVSEQKTVNVAEATAPTTLGNVVTVYKGYQATQKQITVGTALATKTYTPTTTDQTIPAGQYTTGVQTFKGDANFKAENIANGVTMWGTKGTYKGLDTSDANAVGSALKEGYTAYVNGKKIYGELPNVGLFQDGYLTVTIFSGWTFGGSLTLTDSNLTAANIKKGVSIFGVAGSIDLSNLLPENIKSGVTINGVTGTYEGSGSTADKQVLVLSGFSSSETAIYGVDLNGEYVLVSADVSSYDRVWVCEANGVQLMYKSAWGYWGLVNNTASGGNTYTYGEGDNPYKADGSSAQWQTQGANISATAVVKGNSSGGDSGESGGDSEPDTPDVETSYLLVSGFSPSNFGGVGTTLDPNRKYYLEDETATGNERVWISKDGYFKIYSPVGSGGYWYLDSVEENLGQSVYIDNSLDNPYQEDGSTYSWWSMGSPISGASVTLVSSANSGGGTSNADYTVSGSSTTEVNGDYINTGRISNDRPVYTNDTYYMRWYSGMWEITEEDENSNMKPPKHSVSSSDMTPPASGWYGGITVTSGGNESSTPADYIVSGAGTEAVNGNYYATGEYYEGRNSAPIYKNKNGVYFFATGSHNIFANSITTDLNIETYYHCEAYGDYYTTGAWANDALYPTCGEFGIEPFPTVTKA